MMTNISNISILFQCHHQTVSRRNKIMSILIASRIYKKFLFRLCFVLYVRSNFMLIFILHIAHYLNLEG